MAARRLIIKTTGRRPRRHLVELDGDLTDARWEAVVQAAEQAAKGEQRPGRKHTAKRPATAGRKKTATREKE